MLTVVGFFLYVWGNMSHPNKMYVSMIKALELDFVPVVLYCMIFRQKKPDVWYNGIFPSAEFFAMYCALMGAVFLVELVRCLQREDTYVSYVIYGS